MVDWNPVPLKSSAKGERGVDLVFATAGQDDIAVPGDADDIHLLGVKVDGTQHHGIGAEQIVAVGAGIVAVDAQQQDIHPVFQEIQIGLAQKGIVVAGFVDRRRLGIPK